MQEHVRRGAHGPVIPVGCRLRVWCVALWNVVARRLCCLVRLGGATDFGSTAVNGPVVGVSHPLISARVLQSVNLARTSAAGGIWSHGPVIPVEMSPSGVVRCVVERRCPPGVLLGMVGRSSGDFGSTAVNGPVVRAPHPLNSAHRAHFITMRAHFITMRTPSVSSRSGRISSRCRCMTDWVLCK